MERTSQPQEEIQKSVQSIVQELHIQDDVSWLEIDTFEEDLNENYVHSVLTNTEMSSIESLLDSMLCLQSTTVSDYDKAAAAVDLDPIRVLRSNPGKPPVRYAAHRWGKLVRLYRKLQRGACPTNQS
jgi:hypothetical protein